MSLSTVDILLVLKKGINSTNAIQDFHGLMAKNNVDIDENGLYYLNDHNDIESFPEDIKNTKESFKKLRHWPTAGWIEFCIENCSLLVSFKTSKEFCLSGIYISAYEDEYRLHATLLDNIIHKLHEFFMPIRTIKGLNVFLNFWPEDEIERVHNGVFMHKYEIDLR